MIVLLLDFTVSLFVPASTVSNLAAARERESGVYDLTVAYHHDHRPNLVRQRM